MQVGIGQARKNRLAIKIYQSGSGGGETADLRIVAHCDYAAIADGQRLNTRSNRVQSDDVAIV